MRPVREKIRRLREAVAELIRVYIELLVIEILSVSDILVEISCAL